MANARSESIQTKAQILKLCANEYQTPTKLAEALGKSVHTVRAYYVYPMVREGLLKTLHPPGRKVNQAYTAA